MSIKTLTNQPKISGISKGKLMAAGIIFILAVSFIVVYGVDYSSDNTPSSTFNENSQPQRYSANNTNQNIENIIDKSNSNIAKITASKPVTQPNLGLQQPKFDASSSLPQISNTKSNNIIVPPVSDTDAQQFKTQQVQIENQFKLNRIKNTYAAYTSKSLIFSGKSIKNNASNVIDTNSSNLSQDTNTSGAGQLASNNPVPIMSDNSSQPGGQQSVDQNNQQEKEKFAKSLSGNNGANEQYLSARIQDPASPYLLSAGSVIPAKMIGGLNSDLPGQFAGVVSENVYDSKTHRILLIPQGSKLIGLYDSNITYGQERILVVLTRLIYPDTSSINLKGMPGTDLEGYAGFYDEVDNHYWKIFGTSFIMGVITAGIQYSQNNTNANVQSGGIGYTNPNPSVGQTLSGSLGQQLGQTGLAVTQKNLNVQPTLIIKPGYPFNVMTTADMILRPYSK
jgi:type IV secretory pathway VirB10-like protein